MHRNCLLDPELKNGSIVFTVCEPGTHWLLEAKGQENIDVIRKDNAAVRWCENVTTLTGTVWRYVKVPQKEYETLRPSQLADLGSATFVFVLGWEQPKNHTNRVALAAPQSAIIQAWNIKSAPSSAFASTPARS